MVRMTTRFESWMARAAAETGPLWLRLRRVLLRAAAETGALWRRGEQRLPLDHERRQAVLDAVASHGRAALVWGKDVLRRHLSAEKLKTRFKAARTWAVEHDTVPAEATARLRDRWLTRRQRHEQREAERHQRQEEHARKREKKDEEGRQTYSVYFE